MAGSLTERGPRFFIDHAVTVCAQAAPGLQSTGT